MNLNFLIEIGEIGVNKIILSKQLKILITHTHTNRNYKQTSNCVGFVINQEKVKEKNERKFCIKKS